MEFPPRVFTYFEAQTFWGSVSVIAKGRQKTTTDVEKGAGSRLLRPTIGLGELPGSAGLGMIGASGVLEVFDSRAKDGAGFVALALSLEGATGVAGKCPSPRAVSRP